MVFNMSPLFGPEATHAGGLGSPTGACPSQAKAEFSIPFGRELSAGKTRAPRENSADILYLNREPFAPSRHRLGGPAGHERVCGVPAAHVRVSIDDMSRLG